MEQITLIAITKFGLETVVKNEITELGFENLRVSDGKIEFDAELSDIPRLNLWLRCADRVLLKIAEFKAFTFDELYEKTKTLPWEQWIPVDGEFPVDAKTVKSTLQSSKTCQSIVKKAVVDRLMDHYAVDSFSETGSLYSIKISIRDDIAQLTIDTSGVGLHKRGYREEGGDAPLKETLAAALVKLSFWAKDRLLIDPLCGSGTILIEAAMIARNIAPGLKRTFAAEEWPLIGSDVWQAARRAAQDAKLVNDDLQIFGYDIDAVSVKTARFNANKAGVSRNISFEQKDVKELWIDRQYGVLISNPPYGRRMANYRELNAIYIALNKTFRKKNGWSIYILTADSKFPDYFKRARPNRVRKLYNGNIKVNYYQYYGEKPPNEGV
ncbi:MAG: class I SAM-dependent RNA methyltransferase [Anaerolineales bacterium]|nr:class I SAM-dependent RNA methyltransferase [Anaerolineales bacterium]